MDDRIFVGVFPTGLSYADRTKEEHGDYKRLAFLHFDSLVLEIRPDCQRELRPSLKSDAMRIQAMKGQEYEVSGSGQTVLLGGR